ncbi:hydantoinase/oxoprolinase family protein [Comamonadaceae bacterium G21597-S1]|nr:hydantoinase/oxoprolinase family protein [Comamonadaceae bacterium G21597-S1]
MRELLLGIDIGGTFTDLVLVDSSTGQMFVDKVPSSPEDPSIAFFQGLERVLRQAEASTDQLKQVIHGSTVATNAILEGKGARAGMVTTAGFRHVLEIARHEIPRSASMNSWVKPHKPISPDRIVEVGERTEKDGSISKALDEASTRVALQTLLDKGVESIAICLLHSYANSENERKVSEILRAMAPGLQVSLSSEILPVFREYERSMATVLNAYLQPKVSHYISALQRGVAERQLHAPLMIMKSDGGVVSAAEAAREPVQMVMSGPAAGVVGALFSGESIGVADLITFDMGGTSTDVCLIDGGKPAKTSEGSIDIFPIAIPMLDIHTIGAGGGSIAQVTPSGALNVGPGSAGARPGPVCYGRGGKLPTVSDANLVLGRLPNSLLNGGMTLDLKSARQAIASQIAEPMGLTIEAAAEGILEIVNNHMMGAVRVISVERGFDPQDFTLVSFGGAGGLHAGSVAALTGSRTVLVPPRPGVLCALGLLGSKVTVSHARTCMQKPPHINYDLVASVFADLTKKAVSWLDENKVPDQARQVRWAADLRYAHQGFEIEVDGAPTSDIQSLISDFFYRFHQRHEQLYRHKSMETPVEIINLRVTASGELIRLEAPRQPGGNQLSDALVERRPVHFRETGWIDCPCYERSRLPVDQVITGPAIIQQMDATTVLFPGHTMRQDGFGNILMTIAP